MLSSESILLKTVLERELQHVNMLVSIGENDLRTHEDIWNLVITRKYLEERIESLALGE